MENLEVEKHGPGTASLPSTRTASLAESSSSRSGHEDIGIEEAGKQGANSKELEPGSKHGLSPDLLAQTPSHASTMTNLPEYGVDWEGDDDKKNPRNWSV
jgi:hypothetical protein